MKQLIDFFPSGLPDESLHSRMSRYHRISGNLFCKHSIFDLFDLTSAVVTSHLPNHLSRLSNKLPNNDTYDVASLIDSFTLYPYFRPFLSEDQNTQCIQGMSGDDARPIKLSMGVVASRIGAGNNFRYCQQCMLNDDREFGIAYWHRSHLLPGVLICHIHQIPLFQVSTNWVDKNRYRLFLPNDPCLVEYTKPVLIKDEQFVLLSELATLSSKVLQSTQSPIDPASLLVYYRALAKEKGLIDCSDRLRIAEIRHRVQEFNRKIPSTPDFIFTRINGVASPFWVHALIRDARATYHPLKHLLLSLFLRNDYSKGSIKPLASVEKKIALFTRKRNLNRLMLHN